MEHCRHIRVSLISADLRTVPTQGKAGVWESQITLHIGALKSGMYAGGVYINLYEERFNGLLRIGSSGTGLPAGFVSFPHLPLNFPSFQRWRQCLSVYSETLLLFCFIRVSTPQRNRFFVTFRRTTTLVRVIKVGTRDTERIYKAAALVHAEGRTRDSRHSSGLDRPNPPRISVEVDGSCGLILRPQPASCNCGCCVSTAANRPTAS